MSYSEQHQRELLELTTKAGRRCAHDLQHAAEFIRDAEMRKLFSTRAREWLVIFYPDSGPKNYRAELHQKISRLENEIDRLKRICNGHGVDHTNPDGVPF